LGVALFEPITEGMIQIFGSDGMGCICMDKEGAEQQGEGEEGQSQFEAFVE
jgi:hypothetical protein